MKLQTQKVRIKWHGGKITILSLFSIQESLEVEESEVMQGKFTQEIADYNKLAINMFKKENQPDGNYFLLRKIIVT